MSDSASPLPFFFTSRDGTPLFGVWRAPQSPVERVCVVVPPFGEEEKAARRVLTSLLQNWREAGVASLFLSLRGTGDAGGDFVEATLAAWRDDVRAACDEARRRAPHAALCLLGLRLGAALAPQVAAEVGAASLVLLEPVLDGRRFVSQLEGRSRLRARMTEAESGAPQTVPAAEKSAFDLDGWPLSAALRDELRALSAVATPRFAGVSLVVQIGPRPELAPPLLAFADALGAETRAVVMPPFWNANDELDAAPLLEAVAPPPQVPVSPCAPTPAAVAPQISERPLCFQNGAGQRLVGVWHEPQSAPRDLTLVMLHGWSGYRIGPHQMLTRAARELAREGFGTLRFDFAGRGDADGITAHATLATMREDLRAALAWCRENVKSERFALLGICAGCEIAFAGADEAGVAGLGLWSAPVFAAHESSERAARRRGHFLRQYARKLLNLETYRKLLAGRLDARGVQGVLSGRNTGEAKNRESSEPGRLPVGWKAARLDAFRAARRPCLLVYGTADPTAQEALAWYEARCGEAGVAPQVHQVAGANHSYYGLAWERDVFAATRLWLETV